MDSEDDFKLKYESSTESSFEEADESSVAEITGDEDITTTRQVQMISRTIESTRRSESQKNFPSVFNGSKSDLDVFVGVLESSTGVKWRTNVREIILFERDDCVSGRAYAVMSQSKRPSSAKRSSVDIKKKTKEQKIQKGGLFKGMKDINTYRRYLERMLSLGNLSAGFSKVKRA